MSFVLSLILSYIAFQHPSLGLQPFQKSDKKLIHPNKLINDILVENKAKLDELCKSLDCLRKETQKKYQSGKIDKEAYRQDLNYLDEQELFYRKVLGGLLENTSKKP
jgi:hypothetical protein